MLLHTAKTHLRISTSSDYFIPAKNCIFFHQSVCHQKRIIAQPQIRIRFMLCRCGSSTTYTVCYMATIM